ncbi:hypothetical protein K505DRAFT_297791 [Melanomma pulvis-pyrius CBS 109.77]|uniref:Septin-type G domain-containing protein n=1 Tax=Melanomma pulvis-pyrius CBS 109.77 TaxID=1314802 RepID=A0A6A6XNF0_9PLEO|nr:hypothetical protein K505DRAFT_297791 [Melanomma pulvis-pyrius CBS 109.77]
MRPSAGGDALPSARPRSRKASADYSATHGIPSSHVPTTFFLRSEEDIERAVGGSQGTEPASRSRESTFGVQSLADTLEAAFGQDSGPADSQSAASMASSAKESPKSTSHISPRPLARQPESVKATPVRKHRRKTSIHAPSVPRTPPRTDAPSPIPTPAIPSTPRSLSVQSLKLTDEESGPDEAASHVVTSSEEEEERQQSDSGSFPQLVMPSIQMPARRPFTIKGKAMGKLKILIVGESGIGKTSLIRSIVQLCDDIVHVDPLSPTKSFPQSSPPKTRSPRRRTDGTGTKRIMEINASTKPYPPWWTDLEQSRALRRRKSSSDAVLERNLCFVDTPGFGKGAAGVDDMNLVLEYVEDLLLQTSSVTSMEDSDLIGVVSGNGGVQVDVVFYLLPPTHDISRDVEFMQRLSNLTNVIPVIAKSDTLSASEIAAVKTSILARLQTTSIKPFLFGKAIDDALLAVQGLSVSTSPSSSITAASEQTQYPFPVPTYPFAISSTPGPDTDTMDASLLMSPEYMQPLLPSELGALVSQVFEPENIAWLRHSAGKKFLSWRHRTKWPGDTLGDSFALARLSLRPVNRGSVSSSSAGANGANHNGKKSCLYSCLKLTCSSESGASSIFSAMSPSGVLVPHSTSPFYSNPNSTVQSPFSSASPALSNTHTDPLEPPTDFSLARYNSYAQGEQRLAEVRLAKWATDLQRSLRNERERFAELQKSERAKWLLERVSEEVIEGNIGLLGSPGAARADWAVVRRNGKEKGRRQRYGEVGRLDGRDPLGLLEFSDEVKRRGVVLVKVLGSVSVLGAVMVAVAKACGVATILPQGGVWQWLTGPE